LSAELDGGGGASIAAATLASIDQGWPARPDMGTIEARCSVIVIDQIPWRPIARRAPRALSLRYRTPTAFHLIKRQSGGRQLAPGD